MKKRILALLLTLALVLPAVSCDILLADPNAPVTPTDSQSPSDTPKDTEKEPISVTPETKPQTPPDDPYEPEDSEPGDWNDDPEPAPETEYIEPETEYNVLEEYTVHFVLEGYGENPKAQTVTEGKCAKEPKVSIDPAVGTFEGAWYTEPIYDTPYKFDFNTPITGDITLYGYVIPNPAAPVGLISAEQLATAAKGGHDIGSADVLTQGTHSFVRLTGGGFGDPYFMVARDCGNMPDYLVIRYRTNSTIDGEMFIGSGAGPHGGGDHAIIDWTGDNEWHLAIIHLPTCEAQTIQNGVIDYFRLDFFKKYNKDDYIDIAYIAFFNSAEYAEDYDYENYKAPSWREDQTVVRHVSFDELFSEPGRVGVFTPGQSANWNFVADITDATVDSLHYWGWIAYMGELGQFGYQINGGTPIYNETFAIATEQPVIDASKSIGADSGQRMNIAISLAGLRGEYTVRTLYKSADGIEVCLDEFTVVIPTHYADYNVPQDQWVISGHRPQLQNSSDGMVAAAGVEYAALLHQGSIYLGEIDLSKYSKVVIYWGSDNSQVTMDHYNENAHNRIMLLSADMNMMNSPTEDTIIAGSTYTLHGWAVQAHEIDLTDVDYNGPVYVTWDTLPGTFMLISSVEFIGGEIE